MSNLTKDEQQNIYENIECYCDQCLSTYRKSNINIIDQCVEDQKIIPKIIQVMICNYTYLIKPISQIVVQYIGPVHSQFFDLLLKGQTMINESSYYAPLWMCNTLCTLIKYYNRLHQSWDIPSQQYGYDNDYEIKVLLYYNVNINININKDVKMTDFIKDIYNLLSFNNGLNYPKYSHSDPPAITVQESHARGITNIYKHNKKKTIPQRLQQACQQKHQQKLIKKLIKMKQHNKKNIVAYKKSNNQKRL